MKIETVLVTGGCGFIGSNLCLKLLEKGYQVIAYDNLSKQTSPEELVSAGAKFIKADILDESALLQHFIKADAVIHLAAAGSVIESIDNPKSNFQSNAVGTFNVLNAANKTNIQKVIFASTGGALIGNAEPPVNEDSVPRPISPYGASKLCGEAYCHSFAMAFGLNTVALRFANVYGPRSFHKKGAINAFAKAIMENQDIHIYGDGSASRDFLYVDDLVNGISLALEQNLDPGTVLHLASGVETSVRELAQLLLSISGKHDQPIVYHEQRKGEVDRNFACFDKAKEIMGFAPTVSLEQGMRLTWEWLLAKQIEEKSRLRTA